MSISNREEANKYYQLVNELVDKYIDGHKIRPSNLRSYLKPNSERFKRFLKKNGLEEVTGVDRILNDVIDDRVYLESDGVVTFESFKYFESDEYRINTLSECLWKGIEKSTLEQEKVLANYFDTNLSAIDCLDSGKHLFKIDDWSGDDHLIIIYSEEEIDVIKENFLDYFWSEAKDKTIELSEGIQLELTSLIEKEKFLEKLENKLTKNFLKETICKCLGEEWSFESESSGHFILVS